jgi:hypothetical protein
VSWRTGGVATLIVVFFSSALTVRAYSVGREGIAYWPYAAVVSVLVYFFVAWAASAVEVITRPPDLDSGREDVDPGG